MKRLTLCQRIRWAVYHCPTLLPSIINDPHYDKKITIGILHDLLPRRTSIEIECIGRLSDHIDAGEPMKKHKILQTCDCYPKVIKDYDLYDFGIDDHGRIDFCTECDYDEHNISIKDHTQLIGLYNILNDMKKYCFLNIASGCHIHVDLSKIPDLHTYLIDNQLKTFFTKKCTDGTIEKIFGQYDGHMMTNKTCDHTKSAWINICSNNYESLEFRTAPMTFDYSTIIKWFIAVNKLLNEFEYSIINKTKTKVKRKTESPNVIHGDSAASNYTFADYRYELLDLSVDPPRITTITGG